MTIYIWSEIMLLYESNSPLPELFHNGSAVTVGSFDGPHAGHNILFDSVMEASESFGYTPGIITFMEPLPSLKHSDSYTGNLSTLSQRLDLYGKKGFQFAVVIDFSCDFARIEGSKFLSILLKACRMKFIAEGRDFHFGYRGRCGRTDIIKSSIENGFTAVFPAPEIYGNERISSSRIRECILSGNLSSAGYMLGHPYALDCTGLSRIVSENAFVFRRNAVKQVLPPENTYDVFAITPDKRIRTRLEVGSQTLRLWEPSDNADPRIRAIEFI